jgi:hypothetical protein
MLCDDMQPAGARDGAGRSWAAERFRAIGAFVIRWLRRLIEARRLRLEREREFYRRYKAFCRKNGLSPIDPDDWKTLR